ncbi:hypothetical protein LMG28614_04336 [Paraburkholderia ultramafica]|uniref:Uncharacterized protein n=1 Tax=Paraburkholderia ultramafica TaxID=1544867 RepID=A0A6S7BMJ1_9BURK|nr:hypothetical protein LMG28614_04336 [Paraburkholderia ultramafica]
MVALTDAAGEHTKYRSLSISFAVTVNRYDRLTFGDIASSS